ncbi:glutathione-disulfide reductase [Nitrospirillum sp. BR 11163]|uniref:glutathione-disulfide reductase n=1 Tax=Nitrospirillum sp. BR 11163 TaxID=3104323 RepID=UPI002AFF208B|nr:glutathione-disulfide reductase [Nitrospirillum sp. BR 11163]MEA1675187.1 glutathione-disulfide reductase [Nitrospirillum sp. BR 11163]
MAAYDYDLFTIGAGSGGVRASRIAAGHGARVAVAEERYLGGTCVNVGCVPKKFLVYAAQYSAGFQDAAGYGWDVDARDHDWRRLIANKDAEITRLNGIYRRLLENAGATIFEARATIVDEHTVDVGGKRVTAERILIATGGWPELPEKPGVRDYAITSNEVFHLDKRPEHIAIVGAGYIATEFAGVFNGLGSRTTQIYRGDKLLRGFDEDVRDFLGAEMVKAGVDLRPGTTIERLEKTGRCLVATLSDGTALELDAVLYATGRRPNVRGLGLERVGVELNERGAIKVDDQYRTTVPNIYALGDVTDRVNLTPVATAEGHVLADTLYGNKPRSVNYHNIPTAVFSIPPVATCGMTEAQARAIYPAVDIYRTNFKPMKHTISGRDQRMLMKLVVDRASDRVVGCHLVGDDTPEMIQGVAVAMNAGATKAIFDGTIGLHPTAAEEFVTLRTKVPDSV